MARESFVDEKTARVINREFRPVKAARLWREERDRLSAAGGALTAHLRQVREPQPGQLSQELTHQAAALFSQS